MRHYFESLERYRTAFEEGLGRVLATEGLGTFILATANAACDPGLHRRMRGTLQEGYGGLLEQCRTAVAAGKPLSGSDEDIAVFLQLACIGFDALRPAESRRAGPWRVHFNHLRSFRPRRMAAEKPTSLHRPFERNGFHFNRPFLKDERLAAGRLGGRHAVLLYNKYPFARLHTMLAPDPEAEHPQYLRREDHEWAFRLATEIGRDIGAIGLGYNAHGAYASVNHLHFHLFIGSRELPVADGRWRHNGGPDPYPAYCIGFDEARDAWACITSLHATDTPYNLLYTADAVYCLPRRSQGEHTAAEWVGAMAWHELCGGIVTSNRADYESLEASAIAAELAATVPAGYKTDWCGWGA